MMAALGHGGDGGEGALQSIVESMAGLRGQIATQLVAAQVRKHVSALSIAVHLVVDRASICRNRNDAMDRAVESSKSYGT